MRLFGLGHNLMQPPFFRGVLLASVAPSRARGAANGLALLSVLMWALGGAAAWGAEAKEWIKIYRPEVVQGNFVSREMAQVLKIGMQRQEVRMILGTPLLSDIFHADRWDYLFTLKRTDGAQQQFRLSLFFKGEALTRVEGTDLPSEREFVSAMRQESAPEAGPPLQLTAEQLEKLRQNKKGPTGSATLSHPAPPATRPLDQYPALETPSSTAK
jgi:outer membrane protein assembly factor BamE